MVIAILAVLGLAAGSFVNALVWRLYQQALPVKKRRAGPAALSISQGRSMCPHCGHQLHGKDLLPVLSWLSLQGKCRYCRQSISKQYPLVELVTALIFVISYVWWPEPLDAAGITSLVIWLISLVGLMALLVYDFRWMLLPNRIIAPLLVIAAAGAVLNSLIFSQSFQPLMEALLGALIGGGIFYGLFQVSQGRWIGGGDVKLGFLLGLLVGGPLNAFLMLFLASLLGTLVILPLLSLKKMDVKSRIPFGPFLIGGAFISRLFGEKIIDSYLRLIGF